MKHRMIIDAVQNRLVKCSLSSAFIYLFFASLGDFISAMGNTNRSAVYFRTSVIIIHDKDFCYLINYNVFIGAVCI